MPGSQPPRPAPLPGITLRRQSGHRACAALLWSLAAFAAVQVGTVVVLEYRFPGLRDEEYGHKLGALRKRLAEAPGRPLMLFMGTSRTLNGVLPSALLESSPEGGTVPLAFNFGQTGASAFKQLLLLRRLLRLGICPKHIYLEVMPALLANRGEAYSLVFQRRVGWEDWAVLRRYWPQGCSRLGWCKDNLLLGVTCRQSLVGRVFPWMRAQPDPSHVFWRWHDRYGFSPCASGLTRATPQLHAKGLAHSRQQYLHQLCDFQVAADEARSVREFLDLCRRRQIGVTLVLMPESSVFRSWYPPPAVARLDAFLADLRRDCGVAVVDAHDWVPDWGFVDGHHLLVSGALTFTRRFGREVYQPFLRQRVSR